MGEIVDQLRSVASYGAPDCHVLYEAADEIERLRAVIAGDELTLTRLREALEKIERGGAWDSKAIARAALHTEEPSARAGGADPK
jgi:hypothetical protein